MDRSGLARRAKLYQAEYDYRLPAKQYTILQLDGRAFHTFTKGMEEPFDARFIDNMNKVAVAVLEEITHAQFAYVQSDEINILIADFEDDETGPYYSNRIQKVTSITAGVASATMSRLYPESEKVVLFDARFFTVPDKNAAYEFFLWRQVDAIKNSIQAVAQANFTQKQLFQKRSGDIKQMLEEIEDPWEAYPVHQRQGRLIKRSTEKRIVSYVHGKTKETLTAEAVSKPWRVFDAPSFVGPDFEDMIPDKTLLEIAVE